MDPLGSLGTGESQWPLPGATGRWRLGDGAVRSEASLAYSFPPIHHSISPPSTGGTIAERMPCCEEFVKLDFGQQQTRMAHFQKGRASRKTGERRSRGDRSNEESIAVNRYQNRAFGGLPLYPQSKAGPGTAHARLIGRNAVRGYADRMSASRPPNRAPAPSSSSMRSRRLYLAVRSLRAGAPDLI